MLARTGVSPVVMVTGYRGEELKQQLKDTDIIFIQNRQYASTEMLDPLKLGFEAIKRTMQRGACHARGRACRNRRNCKKIIDADSPIVRTKCAGRRGHPVKLQLSNDGSCIIVSGRAGTEGLLKSCSGFDSGCRSR